MRRITSRRSARSEPPKARHSSSSAGVRIRSNVRRRLPSRPLPSTSAARLTGPTAGRILRHRASRRRDKFRSRSPKRSNGRRRRCRRRKPARRSPDAPMATGRRHSPGGRSATGRRRSLAAPSVTLRRGRRSLHAGSRRLASGPRLLLPEPIPRVQATSSIAIRGGMFGRSA